MAAKTCGMDRQTLRDWVHRYNVHGLTGLANRKRAGRPPKLNAEQKEAFKQPKYIPAEVFDKRAVDKGQVVFHDVSFIEATPRYRQDATGSRVRIELTDF